MLLLRDKGNFSIINFKNFLIKGKHFFLVPCEVIGSDPGLNVLVLGFTADSAGSDYFVLARTITQIENRFDFILNQAPNAKLAWKWRFNQHFYFKLA